MQSPRDLFDVYERQIAFAPLDSANVSPIKPTHIGKLLLGHSELVPPAANGSPKPDSYVEWTHRSSYLSLTVDTSTDYEYHRPMPIDIGEKRTRLPIMLLVVSGYFLGVMLPLPVQGISWLRRNSEFWALVLFLAFLFLFSKGRERLIGLLRELESQSELEMTRADERYERVVHYVSLGYALCICVIWGFGAGYFARENLGLNIYISIAIGVFLCWGSVAFVLRG